MTKLGKFKRANVTKEKDYFVLCIKNFTSFVPQREGKYCVFDNVIIFVLVKKRPVKHSLLF